MDKKHIRNISIAAVLIAILSTCIIYAAVNNEVWIHNNGNLRIEGQIEVYHDEACTQPITTLDWGTLTINQAAYKEVYIKNIGDETVTLFMFQENWNEDAFYDVSEINWDAPNELNAGQTVKVTLSWTITSIPQTANRVMTYDLVIGSLVESETIVETTYSQVVGTVVTQQ